MHKVVVTGTGLITSAGVGADRLLQAMNSGAHFFGHHTKSGWNPTKARLPWPVAVVDWSAVPWPNGEYWSNNRKYANVAAYAAVAVATQAIENAGRADGSEASRCGVVMAISSTGSEELGAIMPNLAMLAESDERPLPTLLYEEVPDYTYIRGISSQIGQFVAMETGFRGSNVAVYGEAGASGLSALSLAMRLIESNELDRVIVVGVVPPLPIGAYVAFERDEPLADAAESSRGPFDEGRTGMLLGQSAVALVIEQEALVRARGVTPLAEMSACEAISAATRGEAVEYAVRATLDRADRHPAIWWASGTGSKALDSDECRFAGPMINASVTSTRGTIGNAPECAALVDVAVAVLRRRKIPPIGLLKNPDPALGEIDFVVGAPRAIPGARSALITALGSGASTTAGAVIIARV